MKSKQILSILFLIGLFVGCTSTKKIAHKEINHNYYNITFQPEALTKKGFGNVDVTITPIDAASINRETFEAASRDGNYEKELAIEIEKQKNELDGLARYERVILKGRINGIEAIDNLQTKGAIPLNVAHKLKMRIWFGKEYGYDGSEVAALADAETFSDLFNQYKINDKYLSVFKVSFENRGSEIEKILLKEFQIVSGEELLYPLGMEYFEDNLSGEPEKIKNAYRMNMPKELTITPGNKITKFLAIPAINSRSEKLQVQMIRGSEIVNFDFSVKEESLNKTYKVENYELVSDGLNDSYNYYYYYYYAVSYQGGASFALANQNIFVSEEKKGIPVTIYAVAIHKTKSKAVTAKVENITFATQKNNRVIIHF